MAYTRNTSKMDIVPLKGVRKLKEACWIIQYYYNCSKATILSIEDARHPQSGIFYQQIMMSLWSGKIPLHRFEQIGQIWEAMFSEHTLEWNDIDDYVYKTVFYHIQNKAYIYDS